MYTALEDESLFYPSPSAAVLPGVCVETHADAHENEECRGGGGVFAEVREVCQNGLGGGRRLGGAAGVGIHIEATSQTTRTTARERLSRAVKKKDSSTTSKLWRFSKARHNSKSLAKTTKHPTAARTCMKAFAVETRAFHQEQAHCSLAPLLSCSAPLLLHSSFAPLLWISIPFPLTLFVYPS